VSLYAPRLNPRNYDKNGNLILGARRDTDVDEDDFEDLSLNPEPISLQGKLRLHRDQQLAKKAKEEAARLAAIEAQKSESLQSSIENDAGQTEPQTANGDISSSEAAGTASEPKSASQPDTHTTPRAPAPAETPSRGWGLSSLFGSVSKYVPGLLRPLNMIPETSVDQDEPQAELTVQLSQPILQSGNSRSKATRTPSMTYAQRKALKEQRQARKDEEARAEERRKAELALAEKRFAEQVAREAERMYQERLKADEATNLTETGQKRKRYSPKTIPNPKGSSYGMDINFFGDSSSSDEDNDSGAPDDSPSFRRATKKPRLSMDAPSTPPKQILGDPHHARPYMGAMFADPKPNLFSQSISKANTSNNGPTPNVTFSVPDDDSSDEDEPVAPPPRPTPSHATLPSENLHHALASDNNAALERARSQALKYTPKHPSSLRTASRLSTSTLASDIVDVSETPAASQVPAAITPVPVTAAAPSKPVTRAPFSDVSGNSMVKDKIDTYSMQISNEQLIKFDFSVLTGKDITTNPKVISYLDAYCTPAVMDEDHKIYEAGKALFMATAAPSEVF
jgi:hypothetical protein